MVKLFLNGFYLTTQKQPFWLLEDFYITVIGHMYDALWILYSIQSPVKD